MSSTFPGSEAKSVWEWLGYYWELLGIGKTVQFRSSAN